MKFQSRIAVYFMFISLAIVGQACAPSATSKPTSSLPPPPAPDSSRSGAAGEGQRGATNESAIGKSSLDDLTSGKAPVTPSSSPLKDVFFDFDRYDLSADARAVLRANADWLKNNPAVRVEIEGHCDERGTSEYNLALGAKRAQAAREYLASLGIVSERLSTTSFGEEIPVCRESNENCWKQNRRARFVIAPGRPAS
ncbi:MAG TPA: peptidoglycan-associated lipoprotein Pal [Candidatus Limnocylindrales bacterium]|nr:peptidoglycan-associated lipoprotein Pal [Candidatus Limnocylindrales bacterium]